MTHSYCFQNFLTLEVVSNGNKPLANYFANEYQRVDSLTSHPNAPASTIRLEIVKTFPPLPDDVIHRKESFKNLFYYEFAIVGLGTEHATIYFKDHWVSRVYVNAIGVFIQAQVLEPVMYLMLLNKNILFMHSAGVSKNGRAHVFPAHGGTGKTTTCIQLMKDGFSFMGDDLLIIDVDSAIVYPYPRPLHLFSYNVRNLPGARLPLFVSSAIYFKNILRVILEFLLQTDFLISTRVHADKIFADFKLSKPASLDSITFLTKDGAIDPVELTGDLAKHAKNIVNSADLNESLYRLIDDRDTLAATKHKEVELALALLSKANDFRYLNTRNIKLSTIAHLISGDALAVS